MNHSRKKGFTVSPRRKRDICDVANNFRDYFRPMTGGVDWLPIGRILEVLPIVVPGFHLEVCEYEELGEDHGQTDPGKKLIRLRVDVYDGMCSGSGRDRFTAAHEIGHLLLHNQVPVFSRADASNTPTYMNSEWQADAFASALLMDERTLHTCRSLEEVQVRYGVSTAAAQVRFKK